MLLCHNEILLQYDTSIVSLIVYLEFSHFDLHYLYSSTNHPHPGMGGAGGPGEHKTQHPAGPADLSRLFQPADAYLRVLGDKCQTVSETLEELFMAVRHQVRHPG